MTDYRGRIYANMDELYTEVAADEEDRYGYGDESIYDSICYYQAPVSSLKLPIPEPFCACKLRPGEEVSRR